MDTPTQALLGAVVGQAYFSRKLGKRAARKGSNGRRPGKAIRTWA